MNPYTCIFTVCIENILLLLYHVISNCRQNATLVEGADVLVYQHGLQAYTLLT